MRSITQKVPKISSAWVGKFERERRLWDRESWSDSGGGCDEEKRRRKEQHKKGNSCYEFGRLNGSICSLPGQLMYTAIPTKPKNVFLEPGLKQGGRVGRMVGGWSELGI